MTGVQTCALPIFHDIGKTRIPLEIVKISHPLSHFPEAAYPPEGLALLDEVKKFLLAENLVSRDFALAQWRAQED